MDELVVAAVVIKLQREIKALKAELAKYKGTKGLKKYITDSERRTCIEWHYLSWPKCDDEEHKRGRALLALLRGMEQ